MSVNRAYPVAPGIQKIPFKICGWIGIAIYCFFYELEVISSCFPVDMSAMAGAQRPVADDTLLKKLWMSFLPIRFLASGLNKKMEIIQTMMFCSFYISSPISSEKNSSALEV
jgi:hypothetical protein